MKLRRIVSTILIGAMFVFAPSMSPIKPVRATNINAPTCFTGNFTWLAMDTAFAGGTPARLLLPPCPTAHGHVPAWPWVVIGCAGSIVLSALVANFRDHRELTQPEAWSCGLWYWVQPAHH